VAVLQLIRSVMQLPGFETASGGSAQWTSKVRSAVATDQKQQQQLDASFKSLDKNGEGIGPFSVLCN
jgi:hypothetical protein